MAPEPTHDEEAVADPSTEKVKRDDEDVDLAEEMEDATWGEVFQSCCVHTPQEWGMITLGVLACAFFLYWFLFGLDLLGTGAKVMSGCVAGTLFGNDLNPLAGLMIGILCTVLLQSSSTTTSIIVTLVGSDAIDVKQGIYMIMGANIGTSMTNTIVAMGQMGDGDQLERAFAGATVHDMFNFMSVAILLPVEVITGYLRRLTKAMVKNANPEDGEAWEGPVDKYIEPLGARVLKENKDVTRAIAKGEAQCSDFYPMNCDPSVDPPTYESCGGEFGLIKCDDELGCPAFFNPNATPRDDKIAGVVVFLLGVMILFFCMAGLIIILQKMLLEFSTRVLYKATNVNGYLGIAIGTGITMIVQSSSITTSTFTPFVGVGALRLEQMLPITLGANLGTTLTGILSALVSESKNSLQVALAHLFFNVTGVVVFYPIPFMRNIPLYAARQLGKATRIWRGFPLLYLAIMFIGLPLFFLGLSSLFTNDAKGLTVIGTFLVILVAFGGGYLLYWVIYKDGRNKVVSAMEARERRRTTFRDLPETMENLLQRMEALEKNSDGGKHDSSTEAE